MLLNDFYTIEKWSTSDTAAEEVHAMLALNADHPIFAGHFPGQPVVPGACQLQMVEELLSHVLKTDYRLVVARQIKFLTPIDPRRYPRIEASMKYVEARLEAAASGAIPTGFQVTATLLAADATFLKFSGTFRAK